MIGNSYEGLTCRVVHRHHLTEMQEKASIVAENLAKLRPNIHQGKSKVLKVNATSTTPIMLEGEALE